jgi:hypothetical protein
MVLPQSAAMPHPKSKKQTNFDCQTGLAAITAQP